MLANSFKIMAYLPIPGIDVIAACSYGLVHLYGIQGSKKRVARATRTLAKALQLYQRMKGNKRARGNQETQVP